MQFPTAAEDIAKGGKKLWVDPTGLSWGIYQKVLNAMPESTNTKRRKTETNGPTTSAAAAPTAAAQPNLHEAMSPIQMFKAIKACCCSHDMALSCRVLSPRSDLHSSVQQLL